MEESLILLLEFAAVYFIADWLLQSANGFIGIAKNPWHEINNDVKYWPYAMSAHCLMQAAVVYYFLGLPFAAVEFVTHFIIDMTKCGLTSMDKKNAQFALRLDQVSHLTCVAVYWMMYHLQ